MSRVYMALSRNEFQILEMLIEIGHEMYGLDLIRASGGAAKRGTIYATLHRLETRGLINSVPEPNPAAYIGLTRRLYHSTSFGERVYQANQIAKRTLIYVPAN